MAKDEFIEVFYNALKRLSDAERSRLRRAASSPTNDTRIFDILAKLPAPEWSRELFDTIAVLYATAYQCPESEDEHFNLGKILKYCEFSDLRMKALLDTDQENLNFRLRQVFSFINGKRKALNWKILINDIISWEHENKYVQRKWAEGFFAPELSESNK